MDARPNIVVFFTDQQRHDTTGVHGCPLGLTPNFDRLARAGTDIHHSFTCQPVCGPARACLQTGTYATTNGSVTNNIGLTDELPNLAGLFNQAGYHTGYIGKWHLADPATGLTEAGERGAVKAGHRGNYQDWLAVQALEFSVNEYHTVLYDEDDQPVRLPGYRSDAVADAMIRYIDRRADEPFFLMGSFIEPHQQNDVDAFPAPDGYAEQYTGQWVPPDLAALPTHSCETPADRPAAVGAAAGQLGGYFGMVKRLDEALGRVYDALKSLDILEQTIILFTSDHACHFKTRNAEYKRSCHESSIRVPTFLHGGPFTDGGQISQLVSLVDLPPTLLDACGIEPPTTMQGRSILPLVKKTPGAATDWPGEVLVQYSESCAGRAVRTPRWKYAVENHDPTARHQRHVDEYREAHLYDLKYDPHELNNLIDSQNHEGVCATMQQRLLRRMNEIAEPPATIIPAPRQRRGQLAVSAADEQS